MTFLAQCPELLTPSEMARADAFAIAAGTPGIALMERAGAAVARAAERLCRTRGRVKILCGPGGNGGDGLIAARLLAARGYRVETFLLGKREALRGDAGLASARYGGPALPAGDFTPEGADLVIDALFGAGLARDLDGVALACVERMAASGAPVLAVDIPSGIDGESGRVRGAAAPARASVTFFRAKPGHLLLPGRDYVGALEVVDIGIPEAALAAIAPRASANSPAVWRDVM